jgi:hypothetical protein
MDLMSMGSLQRALLIFGATISSALVALALSHRVSTSNLPLLVALCMTLVGIALAIGEGRRIPVRVTALLYRIEPAPAHRP